MYVRVFFIVYYLFYSLWLFLRTFCKMKRNILSLLLKISLAYTKHYMRIECMENALSPALVPRFYYTFWKSRISKQRFCYSIRMEFRMREQSHAFTISVRCGLEIYNS